MKTFLPKLLIAFLLLFFLLGGVLGIWKTTKDFPLANESLSWPTTEGVVLKSKVWRGPGKRKHRITYEYSVNQRTYTSHDVGFVAKVFGDSARKKRDRYPVGKKVRVYYSTEDPNIAVLEPGVKWVGFISAGLISIFFTFIGGLGIFKLFKN